jgi:hypothetical protein
MKSSVKKYKKLQQHLPEHNTNLIKIMMSNRLQSSRKSSKISSKRLVFNTPEKDDA